MENFVYLELKELYVNVNTSHYYVIVQRKCNRLQ